MRYTQASPYFQFAVMANVSTEYMELVYSHNVHNGGFGKLSSSISKKEEIEILIKKHQKIMCERVAFLIGRYDENCIIWSLPSEIIKKIIEYISTDDKLMSFSISVLKKDRQFLRVKTGYIKNSLSEHEESREIPIEYAHNTQNIEKLRWCSIHFDGISQTTKLCNLYVRDIIEQIVKNDTDLSNSIDYNWTDSAYDTTHDIFEEGEDIDLIYDNKPTLSLWKAKLYVRNFDLLNPEHWEMIHPGSLNAPIVNKKDTGMVLVIGFITNNYSDGGPSDYSSYVKRDIYNFINLMKEKSLLDVEGKFSSPVSLVSILNLSVNTHLTKVATEMLRAEKRIVPIEQKYVSVGMIEKKYGKRIVPHWLKELDKKNRKYKSELPNLSNKEHGIFNGEIDYKLLIQPERMRYIERMKAAIYYNGHDKILDCTKILLIITEAVMLMSFMCFIIGFPIAILYFLP